MAKAPRFISESEVNASLDWEYLIDALEEGHRAGRAKIGDLILNEGSKVFYSRAAWLADGDFGVKTFTVFPDNPNSDPPRPSVQGVMVLFDPAAGAARAIMDGAAITAWKTAADSALGSRLLSRKNARVMLMVGAGAMAKPLIEAHCAARPSISEIAIWNRSPARAEALAAALRLEGRSVSVAADLERAARRADVISCATLSTEPLIRGAWLKPGAHLDLVGAFTPEMRECDDEAVIRALIYVDARETALHEAGDLTRPIAAGVISQADIRGDLVDLLAGGAAGRQNEGEITLFKNCGGAHLDLMTARAVERRVST